MSGSPGFMGGNELELEAIALAAKTVLIKRAELEESRLHSECQWYARPRLSARLCGAGRPAYDPGVAEEAATSEG